MSKGKQKKNNGKVNGNNPKINDLATFREV